MANRTASPPANLGNYRNENINLPSNRDGQLHECDMTGRNITLALLLATFAFATGVLVDRKVLAPKQSPPMESAPTTAADALPTMPKITPKRTARSGEKMSLAEAEAELDALRANTRSIHYYESLVQIVRNIDTADIPALLAWCDSLNDRQFKTRIMTPLLSRWGELDPTGAMEFAGKLTKTFERKTPSLPSSRAGRKPMPKAQPNGSQSFARATCETARPRLL